MVKPTPDVPRLLAFGDFFFGLLMQTAGDGPDASMLGDMNRTQLATAHRRFKGRVLYLADKSPEGLRRWSTHLVRACGSVAPHHSHGRAAFPFEEDR